MAMFRFFKLPRHRTFDYKPRYWDPEKEELEKRVKAVEKRNENDPEAMKARISRGLRKRGGGFTDQQFSNRQIRRSNYILLLVLVGLIILTFLFVTLYLPRIEQLFDIK